MTITEKTYIKSKELFTDRFFKRAAKIFRKVKRGERVSPQGGFRHPENLTKGEDFILDLAQVIAEIDSAVDRIRAIQSLCTSHSTYYEKRGFSRVQQHRRNIDWYFAEMYTLSQRILKVLDILKKKLVSVGFTKDSKEFKIIEALIKFHLESFKNPNLVRGKHVHDRSYSDKSLFYVELLERSLLDIQTSQEDKKDLSEDLKFGLKEDRTRWKMIIQESIAAIELHLGYLYYHLQKQKIINKIAQKL